MGIISKHFELILQLDQLIRFKSTGPAKDLATKLGISKCTVYRIIDVMKSMNAPIVYDITHQSFVYTNPGEFKFGFYTYKNGLKQSTV